MTSSDERHFRRIVREELTRVLALAAGRPMLKDESLYMPQGVFEAAAAHIIDSIQDLSAEEDLRVSL